MNLDLASSTAIAAMALIIEATAGYPAALYRRIGHPVEAAGALVALLDRGLNRPEWPETARRASGIVASFVLLAAAAGMAAALSAVARTLDGGGARGWALEAVLASTLLAQRSLHDHVAAVGDALRLEGLDAGRRAVSCIVGRNPQDLDRPAVARAAIESLAENFSDAVISPLLWLTVGGLPGLFVYKAINTADSMIGHLTPRHAAFGWAAARIDDVANLPGARLTALLIAAAAGPRCPQAMRTAWADAGKHRSPNAGWPEAAMAGGLGLRLGGPRRYGDIVVDGAWLGEGRENAAPADIAAALRIYRRACAVALTLTAGAMLFYNT